MTENPMHGIKIEKVTLNVGCGGDANNIERAKKLLKMLANKTPVVTASKSRSTFGVAKGKPVGVMVTLRGKAAEDMVRLALSGVDNKLSSKQFDTSGNFSFGVGEYIEMSNVKYNHEVGMMGFDIAVTLERPGFRVKKRKIKRGKISRKHKITAEESMQWAKEKFGVALTE